MTPTRLKDLAARAAGQRCHSEAAVDRFLTEHGVRDPSQRIAMKHYLEAQGDLAIDQPPLGTLSTDLSRHIPEIPPVWREMAAWLRKAGLSVDRSYTEAEVSSALDCAGLDTLAHIAVKAELSDRGCLRAAVARPSVQASRIWEISTAAERPRPKGRILLDETGQPAVLRDTYW